VQRDEVERAVLARVQAIADPARAGDPGFESALRAAISAALDYGSNPDRGVAVPPLLLAHAREAARSGIGLDTVLRVYFAGYSFLGSLLVEEAEEAGSMSAREVKDVLRMKAVIFDRLVAAISDEYGREAARRGQSANHRRLAQVQRLLEGELVDPAELRYPFGGWHLAAVAHGPGATEAMRRLAAASDKRLLLVRRDRRTVWAWFGGARRELARDAARSLRAPQIPIAFGEPGRGIGGWRLSHRQALAALPVARRGSEPVACYGEVSLLAAAMRDELLADSLRSLYIEPLAGDDGTVREALRAYLSAGGNVSSTAAALGLSRPTVRSRLKQAEERLGRSLGSCTAELETALRLHGLGADTPSAVQS
jgi:hypothetical protein